MNYQMATQRFHGLADLDVVAFDPGNLPDKQAPKHFIVQERELGYRFNLHQHPYVQQLTQRLLSRGTAGLQAADTEYVKKDDSSYETLPDGRFRPELYADFFVPTYDPAPQTATVSVRRPHPVKDLDFTSAGAYTAYNWELFFHVPLTIAIHLSKNQRFAEAQRWFHFLFDPTDNTDGPTPERYWKVRPFQYTDVRKIEELLVNLVTGADKAMRNGTIRSIEAWRDAPFRPHVVARYRQQAYMYKTVMAYLDNLIAWGDSLFRQDTGEAVDEALQIYVLAANILGPRPLPVPKKGSVRPQTYANLRQDIREFGTVMRDIEADVPFDLMPFPIDGDGDRDRLATLRGLGKALYFCVPRNDKLVGYWDTIADRLFKIRNSLNIQGVFRQLPLFEQPIDPALLARAAAAGLDVAAIINGLNQPLPLVRFQLLVQKASEIAQEVRALGTSLLAAMEREDAETLAILRARHERVVTELVEHVRYGQLQEAIKARESLLQSLALAVQRHTFYERQLGKSPEEIENAIPELTSLDRASLTKLRFTMREPTVALRDVEVDIAQDLGASGGRIVSSHEAEELSKSAAARDIQNVVRALTLLGQGLAILPDPEIDAHYWGVGTTIKVVGGTKSARAAKFAGDAALALGDQLAYEAGRAAKIGAYARREQEWAFQSNLAAGEISLIFKQLRAAEIREAIAELELRNHRRQMEHASEIERFLNEEGTENKGKATNKALHAWMKREVKELYSQCFQFAFDTAKKAERALQHELGDPTLSFVKSGYLAGKEGLLAGEKLHLDIKRMEMAYHELNQREYELTKHVSLLQVDPLALIRLRATGQCTVRLPEALFDMDGPGHYFRRIKNVALSIPSVTGPYASVNCTLTLEKSSIRTTPALGGDPYAQEADDERFSDHFGSLQSIVTSSGQHDTGMFDANLRDERYLPFENSGVISQWRLQLPANPSKDEPAQFDYDTISDVILHIRYTARDGGQALRSAAIKHVEDLIVQARAAGSVRLFSVRHEFPAEWSRFTTQPAVPDQRFELKLRLREEHYPFWSKDRLESVRRVDVLARGTPDQQQTRLKVADQPGADDPVHDTLEKEPAFGSLFVGMLDNVPLPIKPIGELKLYFDSNSLADIWLAVKWSP